MKKEVVLSVVIGFGIGLVATFAIYYTRTSIKNASQIQSPLALGENQEQKEVSTTQVLSLASPLDQSISKTAKTTLSGTTTPSSWVAILTEKGEEIIQADKEGNFETEISLIGGENEIRVEAFSENGEKAARVITVVYSTAEI
ncbi:MAG TPA: hypothetical protein VMW25_03675 [Clostridia bacterium]|nr:hypothetical protein [Clostridia bacterium]